MSNLYKDRLGDGYVEAIINRIKFYENCELSDESAISFLGSLSENLIVPDIQLIHALQSDINSAVSIIRCLSRHGYKEAVFSLLANLDIDRDNRELLNLIVDIGLNGDAPTVHNWIIDYSIVEQRSEMISTMVLPYLRESCPEKTLFYALKKYEQQSLLTKTILIDPQAIHAIIFAVCNGKGESEELTDIYRTQDVVLTKIRIILPNEIFNILLRLAWVAQDYVFDLVERHSPDDFIAELRKLTKIIPVYLIPTHLGYPMGGGESFMHQTCRILSEFGIKCIWVSFVDPKAGWYTGGRVTYTPYYTDVRCAEVEGQNCKESVQRAIDLYCPDLIHTQGGISDAVMEIAEEGRLTTMVGYHFWDGLIELGQTHNYHIIENIGQHRLMTPPILQSALIHKYVASEFMQDVYKRLGGVEALHIIHPISDNAHCLVNREDEGYYVLQLNVCSMKGGNIFLECVKALGDDIPFMGIQSEPENSDFGERLVAEVNQHPLCRLQSYGNARVFYHTARMVIVPSLVDETFCRVAFEAAVNGIPVLSTANGYLPYMLGDAGIFISEEADDWVSTIRGLYYDIDRLSKIGEAQRARVQSIFRHDADNFLRFAMNLIDNSANRSIGIFTVWGDQGLGNLSRTYAKLLRRVGYKVHIFSAQPYGVIGKAMVKQYNPEEWSVPANADSVYYSFNCREEVTIHELSQFIVVNNIRTLIVPEVCWQVNWERLFALQSKDLSICSIPMIEIVLKEEISYHNRLSATLYCTKQTEQVLNSAGVNNGTFIGHGFGLPLPQNRVEEKRRHLAQRPKIRFLHVAGHNPKIRKNTPQVIEAFLQALTLRDDIELTVTSMDPLSTYYPEDLPASITVLDHSLSWEEILALYEAHDVSIQVSSHEGLGLGFYESISRSTPVLSLDAPPHNEIVRNGETGWLIPAQPTQVLDNFSSVVSAWCFCTADLTRQIVLLERKVIDQMIVSTGRIFKDHFDEVSLLTRLLQALPCQHMAAFGKDIKVLPAEEAGYERNPQPLSGVPTEQGLDSSPGTAVKVLSSLKFFVKRILFKIARGAYKLTKPFTRRIAAKLRVLMAEVTADMRQEIIALLNQEIESGIRKTLLVKMFHDLTFIKHRMATYAGQNTVLTYLKDESPIFVNTGDLGCPSPIINGGVWEPENLSLLNSFITCKTVFLDIGANVGYFSIAIGNHLKNGGRVFAFEPHPVLANLIRRSIQLNSLEPVVQVLQCAVSDCEGTLDLFYPADHLGQGSSIQNTEKQGQVLSVQSYRIDKLLPEDLVVDLIKIDVEGHELNVLRGMQKTLRRSPNAKILFEKLEPVTPATDEIGRLLFEWGFILYGVGAYGLLVPLDWDSYYAWVGDVFAAPYGVVNSASIQKN